MDPLTPEAVADRLESMQVGVGFETAVKLAAYLNLLEQWNRIHNLTGIRDRAELIDRHLLESFALEPFVVGPTAADVGSGGGLPGIPLAIALPNVGFTLIESRRKRVSFLRHVAATLELGNVTVAHSRAEQMTDGPFETVLARAVAPPAELLAITRPLIASDGRLLLLIGEEKGREIARLADGFNNIPVDMSGLRLKSQVIVLDRVSLS